MDLCKDGASEDESEVKHGTIPTSNEDSNGVMKDGTKDGEPEIEADITRDPKGYGERICVKVDHSMTPSSNKDPGREMEDIPTDVPKKVRRSKPKKEKVGYVHFYEFMPIEKKLSTDEVEKHLLNNIKLRNVLINDYCRHYGDTTDEKSIASLPNYQAFINLITDQDRALVDYEKLTRKSKGKNKTK